MIRINLLPYRAARKKENIRIQVNVFLGSLLILIGLLYLGDSYLKGRINGLQNEIKTTRDQVAKYQLINKEIAEIQQKLRVLEQKIKIIDNLERDRKAPVRNLDEIYRLVVEKRMWYTKIEEKGAAVNVSGIAIDNQTVADYMTKIEKSENFSDVRLASIKQNKVQANGLSMKQFEVTFNKKKAAPATEASKDPIP